MQDLAASAPANCLFKVTMSAEGLEIKHALSFVFLFENSGALCQDMAGGGPMNRLVKTHLLFTGTFLIQRTVYATKILKL